MKQGSVTISWSGNWTTRTSPSQTRRSLANVWAACLNSMPSEVLALQTELTERESVKTALKEEVKELQCKQEQLECFNTSLLHQADPLKEEWEKEAVSYCNALERAQIEKSKLSGAVGSALHEPWIPAVTETLFAEVKDRRWQWNTRATSWKSGISHWRSKIHTREQMNKMKLQPPHCWREGLKLNLNSRSSYLPWWNKEW